MKAKKTLFSRLLIGIFNGLLALLLMATVQLYSAYRKGGGDDSLAVLDAGHYGLGFLVFFMIGFAAGADKVANIWGKVFGTNKP